MSQSSPDPSPDTTKKEVVKLPRIQICLPPLLYDTLKGWSEAEGCNFAALAGFLLADRIREARRKGEFQ